MKNCSISILWSNLSLLHMTKLLHITKFIMYAVLSWFTLFRCNIGFEAIYVLFVWSKNYPKILSVEQKWWISCMMLPHLKRPIEHQWENIGYRQWTRWDISKWNRCNMLINLLTDSIVGFTSLASNFCQPKSRPDPQILMSLSPWSAPTGGEALRSWPSGEQADPCSWGFPSHIPSSSSPRSPCQSDLPRSTQTSHLWQIAAPSACRLLLGVSTVHLFIAWGRDGIVLQCTCPYIKELKLDSLSGGESQEQRTGFGAKLLKREFKLNSQTKFCHKTAHLLTYLYLFLYAYKSIQRLFNKLEIRTNCWRWKKSKIPILKVFYDFLLFVSVFRSVMWTYMFDLLQPKL